MTSDAAAINRFMIDIPDADLDDLRDRLAHIRWADDLAGIGWGGGVPLSYLKELTGYWRTTYDWRAQERLLNSFPQFTTMINGQLIHFVHVRSPRPDALPLLLVHGWPGSIVALQYMIGSLTNPGPRGGNSRDAFHLVIPTLPGFGFSNPVREQGRGDLFRVAAALAELMTRLGYRRFAAQGGDVGCGVCGMLPMVATGRVVGVHLNGPDPFPFGPPDEPDGLTRARVPACGPTDSPVAKLARTVETCRKWTDRELPEEAADRDQLLTNVSLGWLTRRGVSSVNVRYNGARAYRAIVERCAAPSGAPKADRVSPIVGIAVFAVGNNVCCLPEHPGPSVAHWSEFYRAGHFAATEALDLLVGDIREFFRPWR